jgi:hypothetical protein
MQLGLVGVGGVGGMVGWMNDGRCVVVCGEEKTTELYSMMDDMNWIEGRGKREGIGKKKRI